MLAPLTITNKRFSELYRVVTGEAFKNASGYSSLGPVRCAASQAAMGTGRPSR